MGLASIAMFMKKDDIMSLAIITDIADMNIADIMNIAVIIEIKIAIMRVLLVKLLS